MGHEFKIISNGENIDKILDIEIEKKKNQKKDIVFNFDEYSNMINFSIKESILNYFQLPVIVICCFGTQSIGKSTFLNELTGALFDVSGMRCTEGIWMTIKLFTHSLKLDNCNSKCEFCKINNCYLITHEKGKFGKKCICENCMCGKECLLYEEKMNDKSKLNCDLKCCLIKGHEDFIKCSFKDCKCECICECICKKNEAKRHDHICVQCKRESKIKCNCKCNCKHLCKYPILLHNFICVCLDFEGIGTFERTNEQDIQMALIGSAMGNSIIFRTHNSFDRFTEDTLEKLSKGSRKIEMETDDFFGGSLFFSPRDVNSTHKDGLKKEFSQKINNSVKKWFSQSNENNKKYNIFGLFKDFVFSPTPSYFDYSFYKTLREVVVNDIIGKSLKCQRHPIYKTGNQFCTNFKKFLSAVFMKDYEFLSNFRENEIRKYVKENKDKAYEVMGEYEEIEEEIEQKNYIKKLKELRIYYNEDYLKKFEIDFKFKKTAEINNTLIIDNISYPDNIENNNNIEGNYNIEEYGISINVKKIKEQTLSISIENLNDFGLILMIPKKMETIISNNDICSDLFILWDTICKKLKFKERNIIDNYNLFISSLIKRRNNNVNEWIKNITNNYNNLIDLHSSYSPLNDIWKLCNLECKYCYLKCCKLQQNHNGVHECPYKPHKCKEECIFCLDNCTCNNKCQKSCNKDLGHTDQHSCEHPHKCNQKCEYSNLLTRDCKGSCCLKYNHEGAHSCGIEIHH